MKKIVASPETRIRMKANGAKRLNIFSFLPVDRPNCSCQSAIANWKKEMAQYNHYEVKGLMEQMGHFQCPEAQNKPNKYQIICKNCNELIAVCWASDKTLKDWVDLHYVQWCDGHHWYGCLTPHISPISLKLCFECVCGQDTRDFRANATMSPRKIEKFENANKIGRDFGKTNSKFKVVLFKTKNNRYKKRWEQ